MFLGVVGLAGVVGCSMKAAAIFLGVVGLADVVGLLGLVVCCSGCSRPRSGAGVKLSRKGIVGAITSLSRDRYLR